MEAICTHGMPSPASCTDCMYEGNFVCGRRTDTHVDRDRTPEFPAAAIEARYPGWCRTCNLPIHEGQLIVKMTDGNWDHDHCHTPSRWGVDGT